jgi:folate-dependent phosphoribosylglycinamide formyltransferase PurN
MDAAIRASGAQYVALAGYMRILTPEFVSGWEGRMVNIHPSLLPKYKGLHTHERALEAGDSHGGCTVHLVTAELDDGPVLGQTPVAILPGDTADSLAARVLIAEHQLYSRGSVLLVGPDVAIGHDRSAPSRSAGRSAPPSPRSCGFHLGFGRPGQEGRNVLCHLVDLVALVPSS